MASERKRINVMIHDRLTGHVLSIATALKITPNELVNSFAEGCIQQISQHKRPRVAAPIVDLARKTLRRDLTLGDRWVQTQLEKRIPGWPTMTARWRDLVLEEVNLSDDVELSKETIEAARKRADKRWREEGY